ncbi:4Fe-4S dicluster domain-containing protein [Geofilum sp. OHC36d9]|uniref:4Fe-4S dicluster domain-containing protein n=1 Tax=Geofilum sp. OHC36d9 TaxID=3458413 RepID=UPI0040348E96
MSSLFNELQSDIRFQEGLTACMNCGICTAICPAAAYYDYDPRQICQDVQSKDEKTLINLLKSDTIWMCGQCLSCKARCPRNNTPGYIIQALRKLSQQTGFFVHSRMGRQQLRIKRGVGESILSHGYCVHPQLITPEEHPEQGPVWQWVLDCGKELYAQCGSNYYEPGEGGVRKIDDDTLNELHEIFKVTGGLAFFDRIEEAMEGVEEDS